MSCYSGGFDGKSLSAECSLQNSGTEPGGCDLNAEGDAWKFVWIEWTSCVVQEAL